MTEAKETTCEIPLLGALERTAAALALVACGPGRPRVVPLASDSEVVVGRHGSCRLVLPSPLLSRFHARFIRRGTNVIVEDLGSRNGTWLGAERVSRAELVVGSAVRLADVVIALSSLEPTVLTQPVTAGLPEALYLSACSRETRALLQRAARNDLSILLLGETGTGKELAAREIHVASGRKGALRVLNCAAIPSQIIEGTLFGHERGAYTGADRARSSIFEDAHGGTLLLDEVGELSLPAQAALLRVLETRRVTHVGSSREIPFDVRIVSATHRDLDAMTTRGEFRLDLLHRLRVISVELPPLRERRSEIAALVRHFLAGGSGPEQIDAEALACLEAYRWPGNIRELKNVLARAGALASGPSITLADLPDVLRNCSVRVAFHVQEDARSQTSEQGMLRTYLRSVELDRVRRALLECGGNRRHAAAQLGLSLRTFERRVRAARGELGALARALDTDGST